MCLKAAFYRCPAYSAMSVTLGWPGTRATPWNDEVCPCPCLQALAAFSAYPQRCCPSSLLLRMSKLPACRLLSDQCYCCCCGTLSESLPVRPGCLVPHRLLSLPAGWLGRWTIVLLRCQSLCLCALGAPHHPPQKLTQTLHCFQA